MMTCDEAEPLLAEISGHKAENPRLTALAASLRASLFDAARHADGCAACGARLMQLEIAARLMRQAGEVRLPDGFQEELHRKLVAAEPPALSLRTRLAAWTRLHPLSALGLAAALSAVLAMAGTTAVLLHGARDFGAGASWGATSNRSSESAIAAPHFKVPAEKVALVKIDFASAKAIDDVDFEILLPDGLHFFSGGQELAERTFQWRAKLGAGSNVVPIAVKGSHPGRYRVIAHATGRDLDVSQEVVLEVT
jgi:hypothetical protein